MTRDPNDRAATAIWMGLPASQRIRQPPFSFGIRRTPLTVTGLSVLVALLVGAIELMQVGLQELGLHHGVWGWFQTVDLGTLGYAIFGLFTVTWLVALAVWRWGRIEQRLT